MKRDKVRESIRMATRDYINATTTVTDWVTETGIIVIPAHITAWREALQEAFPPEIAWGADQAISEKYDYAADIVRLAKEAQGPLQQKRELETARHQP